MNLSGMVSIMVKTANIKDDNDIKAVWAAIHHYESIQKTKPADYIIPILEGLYKAKDNLEKYHELREEALKYFL